MSMTKYFINYFLLIIIVLCGLIYNIDGVPLSKPVLNSTRKAFQNATRIRGAQKVTTKPIIRKPRFFGKLSFLAGLGLPETGSPSISRNDILLNDRSPTQYTVSYNFPPRRWGPYVAAVYEPLPILSFFQNPWAYLIAALNPFNWFSSSHSGTSSLAHPTNVLVQSITPDKNQDGDILVLVQDPNNEIPSEDHHTIVDKIEVKMDPENFNDARLKNMINTEASISFTKKNDITTNFVTIANDLENVDLIAEETTIKVFEKFKMDDEVDSLHVKATTHKMKKHNVTTTSTTSVTSTKIMSDSPSSVNTMTTEMTTTTIRPNSSLNATHHNSTSQQNSLNSSYHNGYYYHGYPQNISNVEFTSQSTTNTFVPVRYHNFNEINRIFQQYPTSYHDPYKSQSQKSFDHYNRFEQKLPSVNDYYSRNIEFLPNTGNDFVLNGFKPSFPFHL